MNIFQIFLGLFGVSIVVGLLGYNVWNVVSKIKQKKEKKVDGNHENNR